MRLHDSAVQGIVVRSPLDGVTGRRWWMVARTAIADGRSIEPRAGVAGTGTAHSTEQVEAGRRRLGVTAFARLRSRHDPVGAMRMLSITAFFHDGPALGYPSV